jgi:hypothetical protein
MSFATPYERTTTVSRDTPHGGGPATASVTSILYTRRDGAFQFVRQVRRARVPLPVVSGLASGEGRDSRAFQVP